MKIKFDEISFEMSKLATRRYSTSFSLGIRFLHPSLRKPIYSIYGFVRFADEIVDSFHEYDKSVLLDRFKADTYQAIIEKISLNPILNSFQMTVRNYGIDIELIDLFLKSMEMDLQQIIFNKKLYEQYILGSAEVVGLMCLKVYCKGDQNEYEILKPYAQHLGAAYQKINFLRDMSDDYNSLGRVYFPGLDFNGFNDSIKECLLRDIGEDFRVGYEGIMKLPKNARFGVYLSYVYYYNLFHKLNIVSYQTIMEKRIRVQNRYKLILLFQSYLKNKFHMIQWQN